MAGFPSALITCPMWFVFAFPDRVQKEKSEMRRGSRTGRKGKAKPLQPRVTTVSLPEPTAGGEPPGGQGAQGQRWKAWGMGATGRDDGVVRELTLESAQSHRSMVRLGQVGFCSAEISVFLVLYGPGLGGPESKPTLPLCPRAEAFKVHSLWVLGEPGRGIPLSLRQG